MPTPESTLSDAINEIVDRRVEEVLGQYRPLLDRMAAFLNLPAEQVPKPLPVHRLPDRAPKRTQRKQPKRDSSDRARPDAALAIAAAGAFAVGQKVLYKQGRGTFPSVIKAIDATTGSMLLERTTDAKEVLRPANKVASETTAAE